MERRNTERKRIIENYLFGAGRFPVYVLPELRYLVARKEKGNSPRIINASSYASSFNRSVHQFPRRISFETVSPISQVMAKTAARQLIYTGICNGEIDESVIEKEISIFFFQEITRGFRRNLFWFSAMIVIDDVLVDVLSISQKQRLKLICWAHPTWNDFQDCRNSNWKYFLVNDSEDSKFREISATTILVNPLNPIYRNGLKWSGEIVAKLTTPNNKKPYLYRGGREVIYSRDTAVDRVFNPIREDLITREALEMLTAVNPNDGLYTDKAIETLSLKIRELKSSSRLGIAKVES